MGGLFIHAELHLLHPYIVSILVFQHTEATRLTETDLQIHVRRHRIWHNVEEEAGCGLFLQELDHGGSQSLLAMCLLGAEPVDIPALPLLLIDDGECRQFASFSCDQFGNYATILSYHDLIWLNI